MGMITFVDETTSGGRGGGWAVHIAEERLPLRELIRRRVFQEVAEYRARGTGEFSGLVRPAASDPGGIDPEKQTALALRAFESNGFLVLVGERQITRLDEELDLPFGTEVTFLRLVPLVGG
jgi:hypothetical protein